VCWGPSSAAEGQAYRFNIQSKPMEFWFDEEWCAFFRENKFLVGISIDGPRDMHDVYRKDKGGKARGTR